MEAREEGLKRLWEREGACDCERGGAWDWEREVGREGMAKRSSLRRGLKSIFRLLGLWKPSSPAIIAPAIRGDKQRCGVVVRSS